MRLRLLAVTTIVLLALGACGGGATPESAGGGRPAQDPTSSPAAEPSPSPEPGTDVEKAPDAAPDFTVTTFGGGRFTLAERLGMPVVINFFDSW